MNLSILPFQFYYRYKDGDAGLYAGRLMVSLYVPHWFWRGGTYALFAKTVLIYHAPNPKGWKWLWAFAIQILGFGFGLSYDHCDNPFRAQIGGNPKPEALEEERRAVAESKGFERWLRRSF
jgi:hypothetical protein